MATAVRDMTLLLCWNIFSNPRKKIFSKKPCYFLLIKPLQYINKLDIPISTIWTISKDFQRFSQSFPQATQMQTFPNIFLKFSKDFSVKIVEESQEHPKICFDHIVGFKHMYSSGIKILWYHTCVDKTNIFTCGL